MCATSESGVYKELTLLAGSPVDLATGSGTDCSSDRCTGSSNDARGSSGYVLVILLTAVIPLVAMAAAATLTLGGRNDRIMETVRQERALLAAEAGIDEAIYAAAIGTLSDGVAISGNVGPGTQYQVQPSYLFVDGIDNDGDSLIDSADTDENVYQIIVSGTYRGARRKIAAYLGPAGLIPPPEASLAFQLPPTAIVLMAGNALVGNDTRLDGSPGDVSEDVAGLSIAPPGSMAKLSSQLDTNESLLVRGTGSSPSLRVASEAVGLSMLVSKLSSAADVILTSPTYSAAVWSPGILYRSGDLSLNSTTRGSGVLVVSGNLTLSDSSRFDGIVIVQGDLVMAGSAEVYGSVLLDGTALNMNGTAKIYYSKEAVNIANSVSSVFTALEGWQEIAR